MGSSVCLFFLAGVLHGKTKVGIGTDHGECLVNGHQGGVLDAVTQHTDDEAG